MINIQRIRNPYSRSAALLLVLLLAACGRPLAAPTAATSATAAPAVASTSPSVTITGGYDTDPRDGGRPVVLIAAALGVPPGVFREAFSHVQPAPAGQEPNPAQVGLNKAALLRVLGPYGITNDALDRVSDHYRFNGSAGETWPQTPATATAIVTNGVVTGVTITNAGSGYTSTPSITLVGAGNMKATATISFSTDFNTNGALTAITLSAK